MPYEYHLIMFNIRKQLSVVSYIPLFCQTDQQTDMRVYRGVQAPIIERYKRTFASRTSDLNNGGGDEDGKVIIFKKDERIFWLIEVLYAIKKGCPIIYWVNGKMYAKINVLVHKMRKF